MKTEDFFDILCRLEENQVLPEDSDELELTIRCILDKVDQDADDLKKQLVDSLALAIDTDNDEVITLLCKVISEL